jgi:hypothetical protein
VYIRMKTLMTLLGCFRNECQEVTHHMNLCIFRMYNDGFNFVKQQFIGTKNLQQTYLPECRFNVNFCQLWTTYRDFWQGNVGNPKAYWAMG